MGKRKKGAKDGKGKSKQAEFKWKDTGEGERVRDGDGELDDDDEDGKEEEDAEQDGSGIVELEGSEEEAAHKLAALQLNDERREQVANLRAKSLLRRARANVAMGGWGSLQSALEGHPSLPVAVRHSRLTIGAQTTRTSRKWITYRQETRRS